MMATTSTGDGFIYWAPVLTNGDNSLTYTLSTTTVGGPNIAFNAFVAPGTSVIAKIPYALAQLTAGNVQGRLVSGCIRVRYSGTEDARSGIVSLFEDPDHLSVAAQSTNTISLFDSCGKQRVYGDGAWHQINWSGPCKQAEQEYISTAYYSQACLVIAINGTSSSTGTAGSQPFEWECWENLEFLGRDVVGKTNNNLDEVGTKSVIQKAKDKQSQSDPLNPTTGASILKTVFQSKPGGTVVGNALQSLVSGFNPALGALWGTGRNALNSAVNRSSRMTI